MDFTNLNAAEREQYLAHAAQHEERMAAVRARIEAKLEDPNRAHEHEGLRARLAEFDAILADYALARRVAATVAEMEQEGGTA